MKHLGQLYYKHVGNVTITSEDKYTFYVLYFNQQNALIKINKNGA